MLFSPSTRKRISALITFCMLWGHIGPAAAAYVYYAEKTGLRVDGSPTEPNSGLWLSETSVSFGTLQLGQSATRMLTLGNSADSARTVLPPSATNGFAVQSDCPDALAPGATCTLSVAFNAGSVGAFNGSVSVAGNSSAQATLSANVGEPASVAVGGGFFGQVQVGQAPTITVPVYNPGSSAVSLTVPSASAVSGDGFQFSTTTCGASLQAKQSCHVTVQFHATQAGTAQGSLIVQSEKGPLAASLAATAVVPQGRLTTTAVQFDDQALGTPSPTKMLTLVNTGVGPLSVELIGITVTGPFSVKHDCPDALAKGASCQLSLTFTPKELGAASGMLKIPTAGDELTASLYGTASTASLTPVLNFGTQPEGSSSKLTATLINTGTLAMDVTPPTVESVIGQDFSLVSTTCGTSLAPKSSCLVVVQFTPSGTSAARNGSLSVITGAGTLSTTLKGVSDAGQAQLSSDILAFRPQAIGSTSAAQTIRLLNNGTGALLIGSKAVTGEGPFAVAHNCPASLPSQASCELNVAFSPSEPGAATGSATVTTSAGTNTVVLSGVAATVSLPATVGFGNVAVRHPAQRDVTIVNTTPASINVNTPVTGSVTGPGFSLVSTTCSASLASQASCHIVVQFAPSTDGAVEPGILTFSSDAGTSTVTLSGTGVTGGAELSSSILRYEPVALNSTSEPKAVRLTNPTSAPLSLTAIAASLSDFAVTTSCGTSLAPGAACDIEVAFTPKDVGTRTGAVSFNAGGVLQSVQLTGVTAQAALSKLSFGTVQLGDAAVKSATFTNLSPATISLTPPAAAAVSGEGFHFVGTTCTTTLASRASCSVTVEFSPTSANAHTGATLAVSSAAGVSSSTLTGTGQSMTASLSATNLAFSPQALGTKSASRSISLVNAGVGDLQVTTASIGITGPFEVKHNCPTRLAAGAACEMQVAFSPAQAGTATGVLTIPTSAGEQLVTLTGNAATITLTGELEFGVIKVGNSVSKAAVLTNTSAVPLSFNASNTFVLDNGAFVLGANSCGSLAAGASCNVTVTFAPVTTGALVGVLTVTSAAGSTKTVLKGQADPRVIWSSTTALTFEPTAQGVTSAPKSVRVLNTGSVPAALTVPTVAAPFAASTNCTSTLEAGAYCDINVTMTPTSTNTSSGRLTLSGADELISVTLSGVTATATLTSTDFGQVQAEYSLLREASFRNTSAASMALQIPDTSSVTGDGFVFDSTTCTTTLAAGARCKIVVRFSPTATTGYTGALSVTSAAGRSTATLSGAGAGPVSSVSTSALKFSAQQLGTSSLKKAVLLTNAGYGPLTVDTAKFGITGEGFAVTHNCPASLSPGEACALEVTFTPSSTALVSGALTLPNSGGLKSVGLSGAGATASLTAALDYETIAISEYADQSAVLTNTSLVPLNVVVPTAKSVTGTGFSFVSTTCKASLEVNASCSVRVRMTPTTNGKLAGILSVSTGAGTKQTSLTGLGTPPSSFVALSSVTDSQVSVNSTFSPVTTNYAATGVLPSAQTKVVYLRNVYYEGSLIINSAKLTGSIPEFSIVSAARVSNSGTVGTACTVTATTISACSASSSYPHFRIVVQFQPRAAELTTASLSFATNAGNVTQSFTGEGVYDAVALASAAPDTNMPTKGMTIVPTYPATGATNSTSASYYVRNTGMAGKLVLTNVAFSGADAANFTLTEIAVVADSGADTRICSGVTTTRLATPCAANDGGGSYTHFKITVRFTPTAARTYAAVLNVDHTGINEAAVAIDLTSQAVYGAEATLSGTLGSTVAPHGMTLVTTYPATGATNSTTASYYLRHTGSSGALSLNNVTLSGAQAANFKVLGISVISDSGTEVRDCTGVTSTGLTTRCAANDFSSSYRHFKITVQFTPKEAGSYAAALAFNHSGNNGPEAVLDLTSQAVYGVEASLSGASDSNVAPQGMTMVPTYPTTGSTNSTTASYYVRHTGTSGALALNSVTLSGAQAANFKVLGISVVSNSGMVTRGCTGVTSAGLNSRCAANDFSSSYRHFEITVQFTPTTAGTYAAALTISHTGNNGPQAVVDLTSQATYGAIATVSGTSGSTTPTAGMTMVATYPATGSTNSTTASYYVRNTGTPGALALTNVGFSGVDATNFAVTGISVVADSGSETRDCSGVTASGLTTRCVANDTSSGYRHFKITVKFTPTAARAYAATLNVRHSGTNEEVLAIDLASQAVYGAEATLSGASGTTVAPKGMTLVPTYPATGSTNSTTASYYVRHTGSNGVLALNSVALSGAQAANFKVLGISVVSDSGTVTRACSGVTSTGMASRCAANDYSSSYRHFEITVQFTPTVAGPYTAELTINHSGNNGPAAVLDLTSQAVYGVEASLSSAVGATVLPKGMKLVPTYPATGATNSTTANYYVRHTGSSGALALNSVVLSGAQAANFKVLGISVVSEGGSTVRACSGVTATGMATRCVANDYSNSYRHLEITVQFTPTVAGTYSAALTINHTGNNGPQAVLDLTSQATYGAEASVSGTSGSNTPTAGMTLVSTYPATGTSNSTTASYYVRNTGSPGALGLTNVAITGPHATNFKVLEIAVVSEGGSTTRVCSGVTATGLTTRCAANDASTSYRHFEITVQFTPTTAGTYSAALAIDHTGNNGPAATLDLTSRAVYGAQASVSGASGSDTPTASMAMTTTYPATGASNSTSTYYYVRNVGSSGALSLNSVSLKGDQAANFKVTGIAVVSSTGSSSRECTNVTATGLTTRCTASDVSSTYPNFRITVQFTPTSAGTYAAGLVINHSGNNGPEAVVDLTSQAKYSAAVAVSGTHNLNTPPPSLNMVTPYPATGVTGSRTVTYYVRNTGAEGALALNSVSISGAQAANFAIVGVGVAFNSDGSNQSSCSGVTSLGTTTRCVAGEVASKYNSNFYVNVKFTPTEAGTYSALLSLNHSGTNGPITTVDLTSDAVYNAQASLVGSASGDMAAPTSFGTVASSRTQYFYVRNVGSYGRLALKSIAIQGPDAGKFTMVSVYPVNNAGSVGSACSGVVATGMTTACVANDVSAGTYSHFRVGVTFTPGTTGSYSAQMSIEHSGVNGGPIEMVMSGAK